MYLRKRLEVQNNTKLNNKEAGFLDKVVTNTTFNKVIWLKTVNAASGEKKKLISVTFINHR